MSTTFRKIDDTTYLVGDGVNTVKITYVGRHGYQWIAPTGTRIIENTIHDAAREALARVARTTV